jgi:hypothetical protein
MGQAQKCLGNGARTQKGRKKAPHGALLNMLGERLKPDPGQTNEGRRTGGLMEVVINH